MGTISSGMITVLSKKKDKSKLQVFLYQKKDLEGPLFLKKQKKDKSRLRKTPTNPVKFPSWSITKRVNKNKTEI